MENCIFCKIVEKQAAASIIYEDDKVIAFMDIKPLTEGHSLVIPKQHYETICDIPDDLFTETFKVTKKIAIAVKKATKADGISIIQQNGAAAGQDIFHLHVHIIPRHEGHKLPHFTLLKMESREKLDETAARIRSKIQVSSIAAV